MNISGKHFVISFPFLLRIECSKFEEFRWCNFVGLLIASALVGLCDLMLISFSIHQNQLEVTKMMYAIFQILIFVCPCSSCRFLCHVIFGFFENFLISPFQDVTVFTLNTFFFSLPSTIIFSFVALDVFQNSHRLDGNLHL